MSAPKIDACLILLQLPCDERRGILPFRGSRIRIEAEGGKIGEKNWISFDWLYDRDTLFFQRYIKTVARKLRLFSDEIL